MPNRRSKEFTQAWSAKNQAIVQWQEAMAGLSSPLAATVIAWAAAFAQLVTAIVQSATAFARSLAAFV
ncbi:hypothetical protein [Thermocoleostomius sinensis]|uniref:Uncharacterized protein n=1 Tax=Thermocoleostomius sinensis A174 TaxID=2016057 RepID=A0A9E8ZDS9_9CYAN|nr:hypothetical protein [Thermocoleostomius sinensis]WAL61465.1 hypothetical protein OXH18_05595 [Thermocoleostomius sinensis A174]